MLCSSLWEGLVVLLALYVLLPFQAYLKGKNPNLSNSAPEGPDLVLGKTLWSLGRHVQGVTYPKLPLPPCGRASLPTEG